MDETTVVKIGGAIAADPERICADIAALTAGGAPVVLVHGGSVDIDSLAVRLGVPSRRLVAPDGVSARHTDAAMLDVVVTALSGVVKPRLLTALASAGVRAAGLTGLDAGLLRASRKRAHRAVVDGRLTIVRDDHSGRITGVTTDVLSALLGAGIVPVVSPPASCADDQPVNVDADRAAAAIAAALGADTLLLLTGMPGVLADPAREDSVLPACSVPASGPPPTTAAGIGTKLIAAREALCGGVASVVVADGRTAAPVRDALDGGGTTVLLAAGVAKAAG